MKKLFVLKLLCLVTMIMLVSCRLGGEVEDWWEKAREAYKGKSVSIEMVQIPAGTFTMGSNNSRDYYDASPPHQVTLTKGFSMGKYQVTQAQYEAVTGYNPSSSYGAGDNYPVCYVNWYDAVKFCNKLSELQGLTSAYTINGTSVTWNRSATGYRLPTEAEWEYACRAGTTTAYSFGDSDNIGNYAWYYGNSGSETHEVGKKLPNAWGLYDMHGNVWEWCWDWYGSYSSGEQTNPTGAASGSDRVLRGGSWRSDNNDLRSADRYDYNPSYRHHSDSYYDIGFRLVCP